MTTGDEEGQTPVEQVSGRAGDDTRTAELVDLVAASDERYRLMSQVATLQADLSRQAEDLDERDQLLSQLGDKIAGYETELAELDDVRQHLSEVRREHVRTEALLEARGAERQELAAVAQRLQNERDHLQDLLETSLQRYDALDAERIELDDMVRHLEAIRDTTSQEHEARAHELIESRAEMSKLSDRIDDLANALEAANDRAEKAEALAERRANQSSYLDRRLNALNEKLDTASMFEAEAANLRTELSMSNRRIAELERELATQQSEVAASQAAVESIAKRTADYDDLIGQVARLERERDEAWAAASGYPDSRGDYSRQELSSLADQARELGGRRANQPEDAEPQFSALPPPPVGAPAEAAAAAEPASAPAAPAVVEESVADGLDVAEPELEDLGDEDLALIDQDLAAFSGAPAEPADSSASFDSGALEMPDIDLPQLDVPEISLDVDDDVSVPAVMIEADPGEGSTSEPVDVPTRQRLVLPAAIEPNTLEAVEYLMGQPGVTAIVDARSTCSRTGIRPSELFEKVESLRDRFDVPVEVIVTPVSTPVGGAPRLAAVGVHHVTGADTVADRVRALCMGFPLDQPLVVIAGDDHVRRAAISQDANVIEPTAVLNLADV